MFKLCCFLVCNPFVELYRGNEPGRIPCTEIVSGFICSAKLPGIAQCEEMSRGGSKPNLKLRVTPSAEKVLRSGHPWLFAKSILEQNREGQAGELAIVYDK